MSKLILPLGQIGRKAPARELPKWASEFFDAQFPGYKTSAAGLPKWVADAIELLSNAKRSDGEMPGWASYFLERQSKIIPQDRQGLLLRGDISRYARAIKPLSEAQIDRIIGACSTLPENLRAGFMRHGAMLMLQSKNFAPNEGLWIMESVAGNMAGPKNILPQETLKFISSYPMGWCGTSEDFFKRASESGALIEATVQFNGRELKLHIKGFFSFAGKVIAKAADAPEPHPPCMKELAGFPPASPFYSIKIKEGIIQETALARYEGP